MAKYSGYDSSLKVKVTGTYTTIAQVRDIAGPSLKQDVTEVTVRGANKWREWVGGLKDGGEVSLDVLFDPALATHGPAAAPGLVYMLQNGGLEDFQLVFAGGASCTFFALVTGVEPKEPMAGAQTADAKLKISGAPVWA